jgi:hypothetical protein
MENPMQIWRQKTQANACDFYFGRCMVWIMAILTDSFFCGFLSLSRIVPWNKPVPLPSTAFLIHNSLTIVPYDAK